MPSAISAIVEAHLPTAVRPFMFQGMLARELTFDPWKLRLFSKREQIGAVASAFMICSLATTPRRRIALDNETLMEHSESIRRRTKRLRHQEEVCEFLYKVKRLENAWRRSMGIKTAGAL